MLRDVRHKSIFGINFYNISECRVANFKTAIEKM